MFLSQESFAPLRSPPLRSGGSAWRWRLARVHLPDLDDAQRLVEVWKPVTINACVAQPAGEARDQSFLNRSDMMDVFHQNPSLVSPGVEEIAGELRAMIYAEQARHGVAARRAHQPSVHSGQAYSSIGTPTSATIASSGTPRRQ